MRELFDEVAGQSPLDPQEAVRRARASAAQALLRRGGIGAAAGFAVTLDGRPIRRLRNR